LSNAASARWSSRNQGYLPTMPTRSSRLDQLWGDVGAGCNGMTTRIRSLTGEQIGALEMLAGHPEGCTEALLKASGFVRLLGKLIRAELATATQDSARSRMLGATPPRLMGC
jgi:hypothetical protein